MMKAFALSLTCAAGLVAASPATAAAAKPAGSAMPILRDGSHDFDFEFGAWKAHISRRLRPLTGSNEWVEYDGPSTVEKVWGGKGNLGELNVSGKAGKIQGLSFRVYDPQARQWRISWANSANGLLTKPMIGSFDASGRGYFYQEDDLGGRQIFARFIFSDITPRSFRIEQAFSADGGKTWEVNWISTFER